MAVSLRERILALLESEADDETEETTEEAPAEQETVTLTLEQVNELVEAKIAELSTSEAASAEAAAPAEAPQPNVRAARPTPRTQKVAPASRIPDFNTMTYDETREWYGTKFKPDLMAGRETIDWSN